MNVVGTDDGRLGGGQGTAEGTPFDRDQMDRLLDYAQAGIAQLITLQKQAIRSTS